VQRFLGAIEIAEQADQRRQDAPGVRSIQRIDLLPEVRVFRAGHGPLY
jgi:hypothetical protein